MKITKEQAEQMKARVAGAKSKPTVRMNGAILLPVAPCPAPRQSRRDAWNPSPMVKRYRAWKDEFRRLCAEAGWELGDSLTITFIVPMPDSWSNKKKDQMDGKHHQQKTDIENFLKATMDSFGKDDSHVYRIKAIKLWGRSGSITIWPEDLE